MKYETNKKFMNKMCAMFAKNSWEIMLSELYAEEMTCMTSYCQLSCGVIYITVHTEGRKVLRIPDNYFCTKRDLSIHKNEDGTNFTCTTFYFNF